ESPARGETSTGARAGGRDLAMSRQTATDMPIAATTTRPLVNRCSVAVSGLEANVNIREVSVGMLIDQAQTASSRARRPPIRKQLKYCFFPFFASNDTFDEGYSDDAHPRKE